MPRQEQKRPTKPVNRQREEDQVAEMPSSSPSARETAEKTKQDLDALLDDIDGVLEECAEEFVSNYIQRGGQ